MLVAVLIGAVVVVVLVGMFCLVALMALTLRPHMQAVDLAVVNARPRMWKAVRVRWACLFVRAYVFECVLALVVVVMAMEVKWGSGC